MDTLLSQKFVLHETPRCLVLDVSGTCGKMFDPLIVHRVVLVSWVQTKRATLVETDEPQTTDLA